MKNDKVYSGIQRLPVGRASDKLTEGCLVLEGGAFRGVYTSGVIDALMQEDINLRCVFGVSAGAMNGVNYVSGQIGRSGRVNLRYRHDSRYVGLNALRKDKGIIGFSFVFGEMENVEPLDTERLCRGDREFNAVATCLETGKAEALNFSDAEDIFKAVQASASMPFVSKPVELGDKHYLDGGCACKIPYRFALERGFEKIVVVRTRVRSFRKPLKPDHRVNAEKMFYKDYPQFAEELMRSNASYDRQCDELEQLEASGRIFTLAPSDNMSISRLESDMEKLGALYWMGFNDTKARVPELRGYLGIDT